jgi:hypothetical protein
VAICFPVPKHRGGDSHPGSGINAELGGAGNWENPAAGVISATAHSVEMNRIAAPFFEAREGEDVFACALVQQLCRPRINARIRQLT